MHAIRSRLGWLIALAETGLLVSSCAGDPAAAEGDAAGDLAGDVGLALVPPEPPVLTPCPEGWLEEPPLDEFDVATCEPWPDGQPRDCPLGEAHFPGEPGCASIGAPCPAGEWPTDLPSDASIRFVRPGSPAGGVGSVEQPFATLAEALDGVAEGTVVALAKGTYTENVDLPAGVTLWGACAAETLLQGPKSPRQPMGGPSTLTVTGLEAAVRNLRVSGPGTGISLSGPVSLDAQGLLVTVAGDTGIELVGGGAFSGHTVVVRDTRSVSSEIAIGVSASEGAFTLVRAVVEHSIAAQLILGEVRPARLERVAVRHVTSIPFKNGVVPFGVGIGIFDGTHVELDQVVVECHGAAGLIALGLDVVLTATDMVVRGTAEPDCLSGQGILVTDEGLGGGPDVTLERVLLDRNRGLSVGAYGGTLSLRDAIMRDTQPFYGEPDAGGLVVAQGAGADVARVIIRNSVGSGVVVDGSETTLTATDIVVSDTSPPECLPDNCPPYPSSGVAAAGGYVDLERFVVRRTAVCGLQLALDGEIDAADGLVERNPVGANIQTEGFDSERISLRVRFVDNGRDVNGEILPVPDLGTMHLPF